MFKLRTVIRFWTRFLSFHGVVLGLVLFFAFLNELATQSAPILSWPFWLAVGLNMIPAALVIAIVLRLAAHFLQRLYGLNNRRQALQYLIRNRFGKRGFGPFVKVSEGKIDKAMIAPDAGRVLTEIGGEGGLIIHHDSAAVLQQGGRLTRVVRPGIIELAPFEKIYKTVDLRPQCKHRPISAMTQEGIPITWDIEVHYKLEPGCHRPTKDQPFPVLDNAVFEATIGAHVDKGEGTPKFWDWEELVFLNAEIALRSILVHYHLDDLIVPGGRYAQVAREPIHAELAETLRQKVAGYGAKILEVTLHNFEVDDPATQQWIKDWQARWQQAETIRTMLAGDHQRPVDDMLRAEYQRLPLVTLYHELEKQDTGQAIVMMALTHIFLRVMGRIDANKPA